MFENNNLDGRSVGSAALVSFKRGGLFCYLEKRSGSYNIRSPHVMDKAQI